MGNSNPKEDLYEAVNSDKVNEAVKIIKVLNLFLPLK
jgi:hypothetical protein